MGIEHLENIHHGETCWIVGKGPSLANLRKQHIGEGPVITINQAYLSVIALDLDNPIYSMQKDQVEHSWVRPRDEDVLLCHRYESAGGGIYPDHPKRTVWDNEEDFHIVWHMPSIVSATALADWMGCTKVSYLCMDAAVTGDTRTCMMVDGRHEVVGNTGDYLSHRGIVSQVLERTGMNSEWVLPQEG